jgi:hypothetical protein
MPCQYNGSTQKTETKPTEWLQQCVEHSVVFWVDSHADKHSKSLMLLLAQVSMQESIWQLTSTRSISSDSCSLTHRPDRSTLCADLLDSSLAWRPMMFGRRFRRIIASVICSSTLLNSEARLRALDLWWSAGAADAAASCSLISARSTASAIAAAFAFAFANVLVYCSGEQCAVSIGKTCSLGIRVVVFGC